MLKLVCCIVRVLCYVLVFVLCASCFKCLFSCSSFELWIRVCFLCLMFNMFCCIVRVMCSLFLFCVSHGLNACFVVRVLRQLFVFVFCGSCLT